MRNLASFVVGTMGLGFAWPIAAQTTDAPRFGYHHWDGPWQGWFMGPMMMIVFLVIAVIVVVLLVRWLGAQGPGHSGSHHAPSGRSPLDILKERFAKGEIDKEEYEERRRVLGE